VDVVATRTGMGFDLARAATHRLLDAVPVDHVLVVGIAGGIGDARIGEVICPASVSDRGTGAEYRATPFVTGTGSISCSDEFLVDPRRVTELAASGVRALETAAVAAVCVERSVPWSAVRVVSDLATDHPDDSVLSLADADGTPRLADGIRFMLRNPRRIPALVRLGMDSTRAARAAAAEAARQLRALS
jgi:nucleoside phosphorylase